VLLGELYKELDKNKAIANFNKAKMLTKTTLEKEIIQQKIDAIKSAMA
jgi:RNA polymerase sigma-70 factor (ECF subfamily)